MEPFFIAATKSTPEIEIIHDDGTLSIRGMSIPENAAEFYAPVMMEVDRLARHSTGTITTVFDLSYFNSSSLKAIYMILARLKEARIMGSTLEVRWVVEDEDEFMLESSTYFEELLGIAMTIVHVPLREERGERKAS
jgi:hypothetical protein